MLPLIKFDHYIETVKSAFSKLLVPAALTQNQAHGLMIRAQVFTDAFFTYKDVAERALAAKEVKEEEELVTQC